MPYTTMRYSFSKFSEMARPVSIVLFVWFFCNQSWSQPYLDLAKPIIDKEISIKTNVENLWAAWTTKEGLKQFLAPESSIELRPGGQYELFFQPGATEGFKGSEGSKVLSFIPKEMFSFSWTVPVHFSELRANNEMTWIVLNFRKIDNKHSGIRLRHLGWKEGQSWIRLYNYYDETWDAVLGWLKDYLEKE